MPTEFSQQVPRSNQEFELLPLFHVCDSFDARKYIRGSIIEAPEDACEVFSEKLVYLFYGRPAFKFSSEVGSSRDRSLYPVAFLIDAERINAIKRIFPFDSGAMHHGRYRGFVNRKIKLIDFELEPNSGRIRDIVMKFFGSNEHYLDFTVSQIHSDYFDFESSSLAEMIRATSAAPADERRATIEVQVEHRLQLSGGCLKGIIVPTQMRDDPLFQKFISENSIVVYSYDIMVWDPTQCFGIIQAVARSILRNERTPCV